MTGQDKAGSRLTQRQGLLVGWGLIALTLGVFFLLFRQTWSIDLSALYFAAHFYGAGQWDMVYLPGPEVHLANPPAPWRALAEAEGWVEGDLSPYLYPPLWAALLAPLVAQVSAQGFFALGLAVNLAAIAGTIWLSYRLARRPEALGFPGWAGLSLLLVFATSPGMLSVWLNQPQIAVSFLTLAAFALLADRRDLGAGALLGLAAAIKLTPALLVVIFVMERRWRALGAFVAVAGGLGLVSLAVAGWPLHQAFLDKLAAVEGQVTLSRITASLELALYLLGGLFDGSATLAFAPPHMAPEPGWIGWVVRAALLAGLWASWAATRALPEPPRLWARLVAVLLVGLVTNPLAWTHYLLLPLLLLPGLVAFVPAEALAKRLIALVLVLSMPLFLWIARFDQTAAPQALAQLALVLGLWGWVLRLSVRGPL